MYPSLVFLCLFVCFLPKIRFAEGKEWVLTGGMRNKHFIPLPESIQVTGFHSQTIIIYIPSVMAFFFFCPWKIWTLFWSHLLWREDGRLSEKAVENRYLGEAVILSSKTLWFMKALIKSTSVVATLPYPLAPPHWQRPCHILEDAWVISLASQSVDTTST